MKATQTLYSINWPGVIVLFAIFVLINLRGIQVYRENKFRGTVGLISLWLFALMYVGLAIAKLNS